MTPLKWKRTRNPHRLRSLMLERLDRVNADNERAQAQRDTVTDYTIASAMIEFGGSFAAALGQAWMVADEANRTKILHTWPELADEYRELARLKRERTKT